MHYLKSCDVTNTHQMCINTYTFLMHIISNKKKSTYFPIYSTNDGRT